MGKGWSHQHKKRDVGLSGKVQVELSIVVVFAEFDYDEMMNGSKRS